MSSHSRFLLPVSVVLSLAFLASCGGSGNSFVAPTPPPSGSFSASNLNGTYVFSVSGTDAGGAPMGIVGTFTANGQKGITGGTLDLNDPDFSPATYPNTAVTSSSSYTIGVDGRGQITLAASTPFGNNLVFDFVLQDSSHGLITEFDGNATGSGTLDLQSSGVSPTGTYAFIFSGAAVNISASTAAPWAMVGNFTIGSGSAITGLEDSNTDGVATPDLTLSGSLALGPSSTPATTFTPSSGAGQTYDVYAIDANHLKFIEMDTSGTLVGDAYSQNSTAVAAGTYAFVLEGAYPTSDAASAAGGFIVTDGNGNITNSSTIDTNNGGNGDALTTSPSFTGSYTAAGAGRYTLTNLSGFEGTEYVAYPFSGGLLLLEIDNSGIMSGAAYPQTSTTFTAGQGYGFNLTGANLAQASTTGAIEEVDDIAEFSANSTGNAITGLLDENFDPGGSPNYGLQFSSSTYTAPDANGRGQITANVGNSNVSTLNGGFALNFYSVDGTTFPFIEIDGNGQTAAGVFVKQNSSSATPAKEGSHLFVVRPIIKPQAFHRKQQ